MSLESQLQDAITSPLDTSIDETVDHTPIPLPERAHYPTMPPVGGGLRPRLVSQLTRSTLPRSSLTYSRASGAVAGTGIPHAESSAMARRRSFPDLDPVTGLPPDAEGALALAAGAGEAPSPQGYQLQRTITDVLRSPVVSASNVGTSLGLGNLGLGSVASFSTSAGAGDWFGWWGNKKGVDRMMTDEDQAGSIEEEQERIRRKYKTPKHPMVFCHGLLGFDYLGPTALPPLQISHWRGIREVLEANGVDVLITRVPATASVADRAAILAETIGAKYEGKEVNLIGHSMGGLDCRYLASQLRPTNFKIISVTTISTPHRGSPFADYMIDNVVGRERLPSLLGLLETLRLPQSGDGSAFASLGTRAMKEFNAEVIDDANVKYYSWGASFEPGLLDTFKWPHSVILAKEGPNDGLVSVESAKWGEYRGTLLDVNHLDLVGWVNQIRYAIAGWTGKPITFKPATFYLEISDYLAEQGF